MDPIRLARLPMVVGGSLVLMAAALTGLRGVGDEPPAAEPSSGAVVPFEMLPSNHMVVRARLNGKGPYRLIFDLGSPVTLLSSKAATESGAIPEDAPKSFLFNVRGEGEVETLQVGELDATNLPVVVMDHPALKALGGMLGRPLDGIIGYTFFARYKTTIDYQKRQMRFTSVDAPVRNLIKDLPERMLGPKTARTRILAPAGLWGLAVAPLDEPHAQAVRITAVRDGSAAAEAGLQTGDLLSTVDGRWITSIADAYAAAADAEPGTAVPIEILRDGQPRTLSVTPRPGI
jgi:hypothetical protein